MPAASTVKVLISAALWCAVEEGALDAGRRLAAGEAPAPGGGGLLESFDRGTSLTLADLDILMLAVSDNAATNALMEVVGLDRVNALAARLGLTRTAVRRPMMDVEAAERGDDNTTCAGDMAALMAALGRAAEIPLRACRRVLHGLGQSHHTDVIARHLSAPGRVVACKQGMLASVLHDVALVEDGRGRVAMAVLSSPPAAAEGLARLAARIHAVVTAP
jgi:beta-lactamase class A